MKNFLFGAGALYVGAVGAVLDETNRITALQTANFAVTFETKEMKESGWINLYPVDNKQAGAEAKFGCEFGDFVEAIIAYTTGAAKSVSGNVNVYTASCTSTPQPFQMKYVGRMSDGRPAVLEMARVKAPGLTLAMKRDDYTTPGLDMTALPIDENAVPWKLSINQS